MSEQTVWGPSYLDQEIRGNLVHILVSLEKSYIISIIDVNLSNLVCQINSCIQMTSYHMILTDYVEGIDYWSIKQGKQNN